MLRALIVSDNEKATDFYKGFLKENGFADMMVVDSLTGAKRTILDYDFDVSL